MTNTLLPLLFLFFFAGHSFGGAPMTLSDAKDAQRQADVNTILNAVYQYAIDNNGNIPAGIPTNEPKEVCATTSPAKNCVDLSMLIGSYLVNIPSDPDAPVGHTWYSIVTDSKDFRITVTAMMAKNENGISITR